MDEIKIKNVTVSKLFGIYDHSITMKGDGITIIHGLNGVGKTAILTMISSFFNKRLDIFFKYPYDCFKILFSDETYVTIKQLNNDGDMKIKITYLNYDKEFLYQDVDLESMAEKIERRVPYLDHIGEDAWADLRNREVFTSAEFIKKYSDDDINFEMNIDWLIKVQNLVNVSFVETQRLEINNRYINSFLGVLKKRKNKYTVNFYAEKMKNILSEATSEYAKNAQNLDQSFPARLIAYSQSHDLKSLEDGIDEITKDRNRLLSLGILDLVKGSNQTPAKQLDGLNKAHYPVIALYIEDTKNKFSVFNLLSNKVDFLLKNINEKFKNKSISICIKNGLILKDSTGKELALEMLSSGEQHELVLIFNMLFGVDDNSLILIDEPELSLHILWQRCFLSDLKKVTTMRNINFIVATHSPNIIDGNIDLTVDLNK